MVGCCSVTGDPATVNSPAGDGRAHEPRRDEATDLVLGQARDPRLLEAGGAELATGDRHGPAGAGSDGVHAAR